MPDPVPPTGSGDSGRDGGPDRTERALRRTLSNEASAVDPSPAPRVHELADRSRPRRWPAALGVAAAVGVLAVASAIALQPDEAATPIASQSQTPSPSPSPSPTASNGPSLSPSPSPSPTASNGPSLDPSDAPSSDVSPPPASPTSSGASTTTATENVSDAGAVPVIVWNCVMDDAALDPRVAPERATGMRSIVSTTNEAEARVATAVDVLDSQPAQDPDHVNFWALEPADAPPPTRTTVRIGDAGTTVEFSGAALSGLSTGASFQCLTETLVRTVVSNGGAAPVTFLLNGEPAAFAELDFSQPYQPSSALLAGGWILDPYEGQRLAAGTVTLSGTATAFEGNVRWLVRDASGTTVDEGFTQAGANGEYGPWTVPVELRPGTYTAELWQDNEASGDEAIGPRLWEDTKTFTVVP